MNERAASSLFVCSTLVAPCDGDGDGVWYPVVTCLVCLSIGRPTKVKVWRSIGWLVGGSLMTRGTATTLNRDGTCHLIGRRRKRKRKESAGKPSNRFSPAHGSSGRRRVSANSERGGKAKRSTGSYRSLLLSGGPYVYLLSFSLSLSFSLFLSFGLCAYMYLPTSFSFLFQHTETHSDRQTDEQWCRSWKNPLSRSWVCVWTVKQGESLSTTPTPITSPPLL